MWIFLIQISLSRTLIGPGSSESSVLLRWVFALLGRMAGRHHQVSGLATILGMLSLSIQVQAPGTRNYTQETTTRAAKKGADMVLLDREPEVEPNQIAISHTHTFAPRAMRTVKN